MNRILRILTVALIIGILIVPCFAVPVSATSPTLKESLTVGGDADSTEIWGANFEAMQFTSNATAHTVTSIYVMLKRTGSPGTVKVALRNAAAGVPSETNDLGYATLDGNDLGTGYSWREVQITTDVVLLASTQYAIVVSAEDGGVADYVEWQVDSGGGLANAVATISTDNGITWAAETPATADALFQIFGETVLNVVDAKVFQGYLEDDDLLFCIEYYNTYPPYYDSNLDPRSYFQIQLLGLDHATVLAASPLMAWGEAPGSIYLSAASATAITVGGAYRIQVIGTFSPYPVDYHDLTPADWGGGSDLTHLDSWLISTAKSIQNFYGYTGSNVLWQNVTNQGEVLTDAGGALFTIAIPGIATVRPNKFLITQTNPQFSAGTANNVYDTAGGDYRAMLGDEIADDLDSWGDLFNIDGNVMGGWLIGIAAALAALVGVIMGGMGGVGVFVVVSMPILFIGTYTHLLGVQWVLVICAVPAAFMLVRQLWWKPI